MSGWTRASVDSQSLLFQTSSIEELWCPLCPWGPSMWQECFFFFTFPRCVMCDTILSLSSAGSYFRLMAWFLLWYALPTVRPYIDRCVPFQSCLINWIYHMGSPVKVEKHLKDDQENELSVIAKSLNTYVTMILVFSFLIHLQKLVKFCFPLVITVYGECSLVTLKNNFSTRLQYNKMWKEWRALNTSWMHCMITVLFPFKNILSSSPLLFLSNALNNIQKSASGKHYDNTVR